MSGRPSLSIHARPMAAVVAVVVAVAPLACVRRGAGGDPSRPGYGNAAVAGQVASAYHLWWPLTEPEAVAVNGIPAARDGDARALLALAILASGDVRDAAGIARIRKRIDEYLATVKPIIALAADDWHRGYELHRTMHQTFFAGDGELNGYDADQPRLTRVFETGRYNCLSSAVLFVVLARFFGLPVRGVMVPTHVFVELGAPGTRPIEVETTSRLGFDLVHDQKFFAEQGMAWSARRGLPAVTFEDYQRRQILTPAQLMAMAMRNVLPGASEDDSLRLAEMAATVDSEGVEMQQNRLHVYVIEGNHLRDKQAWGTQARFLEVVAPVLSDLAARLPDPETQQTVSWLGWYRAEALMNLGRPDEALAIFDAFAGRVDPTWPDGAQLRTNYWVLLNERLVKLLDAKAWPQAEQLVVGRLEACRADATCGGNAAVLYVNWAVDRHNAGDWPAARQVLQTCVARLPAEARCREMLAELEGQHRF